eukprot:TRINITY_DN36817_c0_g1_i1.p1 TRINITY_DN36817_c0_g1~~TRINITY_DN36817_c0_g1_i1.p1  ORF type:complete len:478 (+),score=64.31 TRINITY_DN36817_c0_g1_i1:52-1485(+)
MLTLSLLAASLTSTSLVTVDIKNPTPIATTDDNYVCFGMDWWPINKCNWGVCPWGDSGILTSNLSSTKLRTVYERLDGAYLRLGGSLCDGIVYDIGAPQNCRNFTPQPPANATWFHGGCMSMDRWGEIVEFAKATDAKLIFAINANYGRTDGVHWDPTNAKALIEHTVAMKYNVFGFEYGNELGYNASVFAAGLHQLHDIIEEAYSKDPSLVVPKIIAPDEITWNDGFFRELIPLVKDIVHAVTWHQYPLGEGYNNPNLNSNIMSPVQHERWFHLAATASATTANVSDGKLQVWMGESGGCANGAHNGTSNRFMDAFWYIDSLGGLAAAGQKVFCRQTVIGGNYEVVDHRTMDPNPDYYGALAFNQLMGTTVLNSTTTDGNVRAWAHCSRTGGSVTFLLINFGNDTVQVKLPASSQPSRDEYHLTARYINDTNVFLNGNMMTFDSDLTPISQSTSSNVVLTNTSYAYIVTHVPGVCQ